MISVKTAQTTNFSAHRNNHYWLTKNLQTYPTSILRYNVIQVNTREVVSTQRFERWLALKRRLPVQLNALELNSPAGYRAKDNAYTLGQGRFNFIQRATPQIPPQNPAKTNFRALLIGTRLLCHAREVSQALFRIAFRLLKIEITYVREPSRLLFWLHRALHRLREHVDRRGMTILQYTRVRAGWHPLAVDHTYVDWIGHCTPSAQFLNKETASTATMLFNRIRTNATTRTFGPSSCNVQYERQSRFLTDKIALEFLSIPTPEADPPNHASINRDIDEMQTLQFHSLE
ncbi:hypothetical protein WN51_06298 [Melipona quadrifasciata]|uniref:Uncharacterized protein n=1 Tax=Melipona quadrifasciata TaxID=166423 RepID=A0A0M8ZQN1_9HYME|nr:hypothetical protein WN51_06298 [Melipona quadrifasciata]